MSSTLFLEFLPVRIALEFSYLSFYFSFSQPFGMLSWEILSTLNFQLFFCFPERYLSFLISSDSSELIVPWLFFNSILFLFHGCSNVIAL